MSFHSDMSDFWHKYRDSRSEMMVSSGIKTGTPNEKVIIAECFDGSMSEWRRSMGNKAALSVWFT